MTADFSFVGVEPSVGTDFSFAPKAADVDVSVAFALPGPTALVVVDEPRDVVVAATIAGPTVFVEFSKLTDVNLLFDRPRATNADLVFGDGEEIVIPPVDVSVAATLPLPTLRALFIPPADVTVSALLPGPSLLADVRLRTPVHVIAMLPGITLSVEAVYSSNTQRPTVGQRAAPWQVADKAEPTGATTGHSDSARAPEGWAAFWEKATGAQQGIEHRLPQVFTRSPVDLHARYQDATGLRAGPEFRHQEATRVPRYTDGVFQDGSKVRSSTDFRHQDGDRTKRTSRLSFFQDATRLSMNRGTDFQAARPAPRAWETLFQDAVPPPPGIWVKPIDPPEPPCYLPDPHLLFSWPWGYTGPHLIFQCGDYAPDPGPEPGGTVVVPIKEVYLTINNATLFRLDNSAIIPTSAMSMSLDVDSWTWSFSAAVRGDALGLLQPNSNGDPVVVQASINSVPYRFVVENLSRERSFNSSQLRVSGRGLSAALDAPYSATQTFNNSVARTAQQLIADALTVNGVPMAWTVDWGITDWLVPANVFSHQGTYQTAINAIAQAAGAYVQPHNTEQRFSVLSKYPTTPWTWGEITADYVIPADVASVEGIQWADKPLYNRVYVHGQEGGVLGRYSRSGSAGDLLAPTVVDPLITHADAVRQRGRSIIGDTGRIATVSLRMPILAETGIIKPGSMIRYNDGAQTRTGISRSVSVDVAMPTIYQTIGIETHV